MRTLSALTLALAALGSPALADMAEDAARVAALAESGPESEYAARSVLGYGFAGSLTLDGCRAETLRRDRGTREDIVVSGAIFDLTDVITGAIKFDITRDAVALFLPLRDGRLAKVRRIDTSVSAALGDQLSGGVSFVTHEAQSVVFRLEGTTDPAAAEALIAALAAYQDAYCAQ